MFTLRSFFLFRLERLDAHRALALARMVFLLLVMVIAATEAFASGESISSRLGRAAYFAASNKNAAFPIRVADGHFSLLLVDLSSKKLRKIGFKNYDLLSPYFSPDGTRLLFTRRAAGQNGSELIVCDTDSLACKSILKNEGNISFPVEIGDGRILYVVSPYVVGFDGRGRYSRNDFWLFEGGSGPRKLTDMQLYQISSIGVTADFVYFSASGPRPNNPVIPPENPDAPKQSDIFKLPFDSVQGKIQAPPSVLTPLFLVDGKAQCPAVSSDGSVVAFLRTRDTGNYHYDLVVRDENGQKEKVIPSGGMGFSRPVVVGHAVYANEIDISQYSIQAVAPGERIAKRIMSITDASIESTDLIELSIAR